MMLRNSLFLHQYIKPVQKVFEEKCIGGT